MKLSNEQLAATFTVTVKPEDHEMVITFVAEDVGKDNVDVQCDFLYDRVVAWYTKYPDITDWKILVDTAKTKVNSMTPYTMKKYEDLIALPNSKKVAILMDDTVDQGAVARFAMNVFDKTNKKVSIFVNEQEATMWLNV